MYWKTTASGTLADGDTTIVNTDGTVSAVGQTGSLIGLQHWELLTKPAKVYQLIARVMFILSDMLQQELLLWKC